MAYQAWGTPAYASFAEEGTPGTEQSPTEWIGKVIVFDPRERNNIKLHRHAGGLNPTSWTPGVKKTDFSLRFKVNEGPLLYMAYGAEQVVGSDPYTHTLTVARPLPSGTFELAIPDGVNYFTRRYIGSKCAKLSLGIDVDGVLIADMDFAALEVAKYAAKTTITDNNAKPYNFDQLTLTMNSTEVINCRNFQYTLNNKVESLPSLGAREPRTWKEGAPVSDLSLETIAYQSNWWDAWDALTEMDADGKFVRTASSDELQIKWYDFAIEDPSIRLPEEGEIPQSITIPPLSAEIIVIDSVTQYAV